jgi:translation initiation factor IF-3
MAEDAGLDLVEISPNASPPVCRIMDYGKYRFEQNKKLAMQKKKQRQVQIKELKMRPGTDVGDYQVKLRSALRFLEEGDKVKFTVRFRGREMSYQELGIELLKRIEHDLGEAALIEQRPKLEGRQIVMVVGPKKK